MRGTGNDAFPRRAILEAVSLALGYVDSRLVRFASIIWSVNASSTLVLSSISALVERSELSRSWLISRIIAIHFSTWVTACLSAKSPRPEVGLDSRSTVTDITIL